MKHEFADEKLTGILDKLTGALPAQVEERVMREMANAKPVRARSRSRLIAIAVGAAVVLFGLGFVTVPMGSAKGALTRAMAAAVQATTVHIIGMESKEKGDFRIEKWLSEDGFSREERWQGGKLASVELDSGDISRHFSFREKPKYSIPDAIEYFDPSKRDKAGAPMPGESYIAALFRGMQQINMFSESKTSERQEATLWGGVIDVVEIEGTIRGGTSICGVGYQEGDQLKIRAEIDHHTGRLLSMTHYIYQGYWGKTYEAKYEWDVLIPDALREYTPPAGTTLKCYNSWKDKVDSVIAEDSSKDWKVTVHSLELDKNGNVYFWLQRQLKRESDSDKYNNCGPVMRVEATDSAGGIYEQYNGHGTFGGYYWTTKIMRKQDGGHPRTITLKITPYNGSAGADDFVVFKDLPLPARQNVDDVFKSEEEVIQY